MRWGEGKRAHLEVASAEGGKGEHDEEQDPSEDQVGLECREGLSGEERSEVRCQAWIMLKAKRKSRKGEAGTHEEEDKDGPEGEVETESRVINGGGGTEGGSDRVVWVDKDCKRPPETAKGCEDEEGEGVSQHPFEQTGDEEAETAQ